MEFKVFILEDGTVKFLYYDELKPLLGIGKSDVKRVSHVDPIMHNNSVVWYADLCPVNGPKLGPFETRELAIAAEIDWLTENDLNRQTNEI